MQQSQNLRCSRCGFPAKGPNISSHLCVNYLNFNVFKPLAMLNSFFRSKLRSQLGKATLYLAIGLFGVHLLLTELAPWFPHLAHIPLLSNPINAIYTPFSVLLVYEVYLLIYYLRRSTTIYIGKQYEIMALILIRNLFKDLSETDFRMASWSDWLHIALFRDLGAVALAFTLIYLFYRISGMYAPHAIESEEEQLIGTKLSSFVRAKKILSGGLLLVFIGLGSYSLLSWTGSLLGWVSIPGINLNHIFFDEFYTFLILSDVCILLFSLLYTDDFPVIIRNSSFVVSTILLKLSLTAQPGMAQILLLVGVAFGLIMLWLSKKFDQLNTQSSR